MKFTFRRAAALFAVLASAWWFWPRPETFFDDLSIPIPARYVVSHASPFWLKTIEDNLVLKIPRSETENVRQVLAAQKRFEVVELSSSGHYADFCSGLESFFPKQPRSLYAGRFEAHDRQKHFYRCKFVFDMDDPGWTYLYINSNSPID